MVSRVIALVLAALVASSAGGGAASAARADNSLTGFGFDTCSAPSQSVMDAWWQGSPYAAVGVYIGGSNRLCAQPELTKGWVTKQRRTGWLALPLWVGPQAACSGYPDVMSPDKPKAQRQGRAQASKAAATAKGLGLGRGSTVYYDLEDYDTTSTACRQAALAFLSGWTKGLHAKGYDSGVYSNIGAAIQSLDVADRLSPGSYAMPDDIWFAWDNGRADTRTDRRVQSDAWDGHSRIHQYDLGVTQTYGGQALVVDRNWVDLGKGSVGSPSRPACRYQGKPVSLDLRSYPKRNRGSTGPVVVAAQCLLRTRGYLKAPITGTYDPQTVVAVTRAQQKLGLTASGRLDRRTWTALLSRGPHPLVKVGSTGDAVRRLQRALTAALGKRVVVDGAYSTRTARAVTRFQRKAGLPATGVADASVWNRLQGGGVQPASR